MKITSRSQLMWRVRQSSKTFAVEHGVHSHMEFVLCVKPAESLPTR